MKLGRRDQENKNRGPSRPPATHPSPTAPDRRWETRPGWSRRPPATYSHTSGCRSGLAPGSYGLDELRVVPRHEDLIARARCRQTDLWPGASVLVPFSSQVPSGRGYSVSWCAFKYFVNSAGTAAQTPCSPHPSGRASRPGRPPRSLPASSPRCACCRPLP